MTVAVVTVAVGEAYQRFLPEWATAVSQLHSQPDEVVIVGDPIPGTIREQIDTLLGDWTWIQGKRPWVHHPQILANDAIRLTGSDWVCKMDVDDLILPHALDPLAEWPADVCMFGINVNNERHLTAPRVTARDVLASPHNLMFAGSPFRRELWEKTPGFQDMIYDDWAFWRSCARAGATFLPTGTIDYLYRLHDSNSSADVDHMTEMTRVFGSER